MYKIKDGKLLKDGKKIFALGESYYPSFHPSKFPVPPEGDRIGEMKKDLKMMAEAGFNHVRFAALGDVKYDEETKTVIPDCSFIDAMTEEAEKNDLSVSVRLEGFSVNLRNFKDADIIDENGKIPEYEWCDFVRTTLHHSGILEDNYIYARDLAKHFSEYPATVACQIYNEPKFPKPDTIITDYNPYAVKAFRAWLVERGEMTAEEAKDYEPPRSLGEQSPHMWALWRVFSTESMRYFLKNAARGATNGSDLPVFTCLTSDTARKYNPRRGVDAFGDAEDMDIVGYTIYRHAWGAEYYPMCLEGDTFQCAAEANGKEAWCIELDSRTYIPPFVYNRGTYASIGSGIKGIVYYQWRGDCPVEGVPFPNSCGILNYDGTKTENFDNAVSVNRWISSMNDLLVNASRAKEGIGLFYSLYSFSYCDALENQGKTEGKSFFNASAVCYNQLYMDIRRAGYTVTVTDAKRLKENKSGIKALIVPDFKYISDEEKAIIEEFYDRGGAVYKNLEIDNLCDPFTGLQKYGLKPKNRREEVFSHRYTPYDLPDIVGYEPIAVSLDPNIGVQVLEGEGYKLLVVTNLSPIKRQTDVNVRISVNFESAEFTAIDGAREVIQNGNILTVKNITDGGIIVLSL